MASCPASYDFDFIVVGSGFGGSVTAHRLTEKGYKVAVMEMGRRWTPENLPHTSWSLHRWFWRPSSGFARVLQHALLPACHHPAWLRRRRRFDHLCLHAAAPAGQSLGQRIVERTGRLEVGDAAALRHRLAHARCHREQNSGSGRPSAQACRRFGGSWKQLLSNPCSDTPIAGGRARRQDGPRSILRRRRSRAHYLPRLWRLHDGLPSRRQEHARSELSLSGGKARGESVRRDARDRCSPAGWHRGWQRGIRGPHREVHRALQHGIAGASPAAASCSPRRRWGRWNCSFT